MKSMSHPPVSLIQLGLALGLYFVLLWGGPFSESLEIAPTLRGIYTIALHAGFAATFGALFARKDTHLRAGSTFVVLCGIAGLVGFALPALMAGYPQLQEESIALSAVLAACSVAMLLYAGVCDMARIAAQVRFGRVLWAGALGLAVFFLVFRLLPSDYRSLAICIVLVPLAVLTMMPLTKTSGTRPAEAPAVSASKLLQLCTSVFLLGLVSTLLIQAGEVVQVFQIAIAVFSGVAFTIIWWVRKRNLGVTNVYLVLFPVVATLLLVLPFGNETFRNVSIFASNAAVQILLLTVLVQPQRAELAYAPRLVVALLAAFHLSAIAGVAGGAAFRNAFGEDNTLMVAAMYLVLYALSAFAFALLALKARKGSARTVDRRRPGVASSSETATAGDTAATADNEPDNNDDLVALAVQTYGLSPREAEVLDLLLKGRDVRTIANMLVISQNTVRFHVKNLYRATGAHGKQELIDAVERLGQN